MKYMKISANIIIWRKRTKHKDKKVYFHYKAKPAQGEKSKKIFKKTVITKKEYERLKKLKKK